MALRDLTDREAVLRAVQEYDVLGRQAFLAKYRFGPARKYLLVHGGRYYDSKAIVGVAHLFQTGALLARSEFTGGVHGAVQRLKVLGFDVVNDEPQPSENTRSEAFELLWNPNDWIWDEAKFRADQNAIAAGSVALGRWSTGSRRDGIQRGDRLFLFLVGAKNRGLIASGHAAGTIFLASHWDQDRSDEAPYVEVAWDALVNPDYVLPWDAIENKVHGFPGRFQAGGQRLNVERIRALEALWQEHFDSVTLEEISDPPAPGIQESYSYGLTRRRNHQRRFRALLFQHYEPVCHVCGFDQIEILEAAHIIADSEGGPSSVENGRLLCPNHHRAHDAGLFHLHEDQAVWVDKDAEFLAPQRQ